MRHIRLRVRLSSLKFAYKCVWALLFTAILLVNTHTDTETGHSFRRVHNCNCIFHGCNLKFIDIHKPHSLTKPANGICQMANGKQADTLTHTHTRHTHNPHAYICKSVGTLLLFVANMLHTCRGPRAEFDRFLLPLRQHLANLSLPISLSLRLYRPAHWGANVSAFFIFMSFAFYIKLCLHLLILLLLLLLPLSS